MSPRPQIRAAAVLALGVTLATCDDTGQPPLRAVDLLPAAGAIVTVPDQEPVTLFVLDPRDPPTGAVHREVPNTIYFEPVPPRLDADGRLLLELASQSTSGRQRFVDLREAFSRGEPGFSMLTVLLDVDGGATLQVRGRVAVAGTEATPPSVPAVLVVQYASRPPSSKAVLKDYRMGRTLAATGVPTDDAGRLSGSIDLEPDCRVVGLLVGPLEDGHAADIAVAELEVVDTGRRTAPSAQPREQIVGREARPGLPLATGAALELDLPPRPGPSRLLIGVAPLARPGLAELIVSVDDRTLRAQPLPAPAAPDEERWHDLDVELPEGAGGRLRIALQARDPDEPVAAVLGVPVLLPDDGSQRATQQRPNIVLISIDTLRNDALTRNGGHPEASPALDAFAARGVAFNTCIAPSAYTLPSHVTMLSGQQPTIHGVQEPTRSIVPGRTELLAETLKGAGYLTAAYNGGGYLGRRFGFSRGFDRYNETDVVHEREDDHLEWIERIADQPFFLFLHTYTVHGCATRLDEPYASRFDGDCDATGVHDGTEVWTDAIDGVGKSIVRPEVIDHLERSYAGALRSCDDQMKRLFDLLDELGLADDTIVLITSDHGQEIGERGVYAHGHSLYEELVRVPLIVVGPGIVEGVEIDAQVGVVDVVPTLLQLAGLSPGPNVQGRSLVAALRGRELRSRPIVSEVDASIRKSALRTVDATKIIHGPLDPELAKPNAREWELYDLADDPAETHDLGDQHAAERQELADRLEEILDAWAEQAELLERTFGEGAHELSSEDIERLQQLGYVDGGG